MSIMGSELSEVLYVENLKERIKKLEEELYNINNTAIPCSKTHSTVPSVFWKGKNIYKKEIKND